MIVILVVVVHYLLPHEEFHLFKSGAVSIQQIVGEIESVGSQISIEFFLLHAFAVDFGGAFWAGAGEISDRVGAHVTVTTWIHVL